MLDQSRNKAATAVYYPVLLLLLTVPLAFSTAIHRFYALPKFIVLLTGTAIILPLAALAWASLARRGDEPSLLFSRGHLTRLGLYLLAAAASTFLGVAPLASLLGSFDNQMGLLTHACYFALFGGLVLGVNRDGRKWRMLLVCMSVSGLLAAAYAWAQFFGLDPFVPPRTYSYNFAGESIIRVASTLGHADYLGNFLLYTTPISAALSFAATKRLRAMALISTALSIGAITMSGTRGAWLGLAAGASAFAILEARRISTRLRRAPSRRALAYAALLLLAATISILVIASSPSARSISARAQVTTSEAMTGAGRTILWRDSLKMVPAYALVGCGPEGFRNAFLAYRSEELSRMAPQINNESSHNSYLNAAISYGLPGAIAYLAIIASTFALLFKARRRAGDPVTKILVTGLLSAFVSVLAHKLFIFDQLPTGLYFFSVVGLAQASANITDEKNRTPRGAKTQAARGRLAGMSALAFAFISGGVIIAAALWYSFAVWQADAAIKKVFSSAAAGDTRAVMVYGERATSGPDPAGDYDFQFARALTSCVERMNDDDEGKREALLVAIAHARKSLPHTLTPNSSYLLLASLSLIEGDKEGLRDNASRALRLDPNYFASHWLMAEAHMTNGDRDQAAREAEAALRLNPSSLGAKLTLDRALGRAGQREFIEALIEEGRALARQGKIRKARKSFVRALRNSNGLCAECREALAELERKR